MILNSSMPMIKIPIGMKRKSIFYELPYWEHINVVHLLDPMHIFKSTSFYRNIPLKQSYTLVVRRDIISSNTKMNHWSRKENRGYNPLDITHEHTTHSVAHKDIKSSNILLDGNFNDKIANFEMVRYHINYLTMHIIRTKGYRTPKYLIDGFVSQMPDVFSFGVVVLKMTFEKEAIFREMGMLLARKSILLWT